MEWYSTEPKHCTACTVSDDRLDDNDDHDDDDKVVDDEDDKNNDDDYDKDHDKDDFSDEVCGTNWQLWDSLTNISHPPAHVSMICHLHDNVDDYIDHHHRHDYKAQWWFL